jgi:hypothetical protein
MEGYFRIVLCNDSTSQPLVLAVADCDTPQAILGQLDRDTKIVKLIYAMDEMYSFVESLKTFPKKVAVLENTITTILTQTVECVVFIREYSGHGFGGALIYMSLRLSRVFFKQYSKGRLFTQSLSNTSEIIAQFMKRFRDLQQSFNSSTSVQTTFVSLRAVEGIQTLSAPSLYRTPVSTLNPDLNVNQSGTRIYSICFPLKWIPQIVLSVNQILEWMPSSSLQRG